jgi:RNA ligase
MPKSKERYPEMKTGKMSYCYQSSPEKCSIHFHKNGVELNKFIQSKYGLPASIEVKESSYSYVSELHISSIAPLDHFFDAVNNKLVNSQTHPELPYTIFKYTQTTVFEQNWNHITMAARGLIVNHETGEIVARPFSKFFNHNEGNAPLDLMHGPAVVMEKLDGSLGISYLDDKGELRIASSGSFMSEQAQHANKVYDSLYRGRWNPNPSLTYMWEIIYPENRIVVNYGDEDDLHLIGAVEKSTGKSLLPSQVIEWKWKKAEEYTSFTSLDQVINSEDRTNKEGFIIHFLDTDVKVKYKHEEYVKIHRISTGLNAKYIYDLMSTGDSSQLDDLMKTAPEEFNNYIIETKNKIQSDYDNLYNSIIKTYDDFMKTLPSDVTQKDFALAVQSNLSRDVAPHVFSLRSGKGVNEKKIWESIKPEFEKSFWSSNKKSSDLE